MTVRLADLDAALDRATGLNLADLLAALGEPAAQSPGCGCHAGRSPRSLD